MGCSVAPSVASDSVRDAGSSVAAASDAQSVRDAEAQSLRYADSVLATLSLRQRAAQMVWPWVLGDFVPEGTPQWNRLRSWFAEEEMGGLIISVGTPTDVAVKLNALQRVSRLPLLVGADLETGAGYRFRAPYFLPNALELGGATNFPPPMAVGATNDSALAYAMGRVTAVEGRAVGVHLVFAPVLDVNNNAANPVINVRSFGEDPRAVARLGASFIRGVQDHGAVATGKHFPGHGDTESNSHLELARVSVSRARLDSVELLPFRAAIAADVGAIMSFHGILPALDASAPATLSRRIMTGLLREEMGFRGLVISDALDMRGVLAQVGPVEATKRVVAAGIHVLLMPAEPKQTIDAIVAGVAEKRYSAAVIDSAARRILAMKHAFGLPTHRTVSLDSVRMRVGITAHNDVARTIARRSITLVRDSLRRIPVTGVAANARVLSITYASRTDLGAGVAFNAELRQRFKNLRTESLRSNDADFSQQRLHALADSADLVIVGLYTTINPSHATTVSTPRAFAEFVRARARRPGATVVVSFGTPYILQQMPEVGTYMVGWGVDTHSQYAAARAVLGLEPIVGVLPISIPPLVSRGVGLRRGAPSSDNRE